jgi:excisionase family DNA binding protein
MSKEMNTSQNSQEILAFTNHLSHCQVRGWTLEEISETLKVSRATLYREIKDGKLQTYKLRGSLRVRHSELVRWNCGIDPLQTV